MGRKSRKAKASTKKVSTGGADAKPEVYSESPVPAVTFQPKCKLYRQLYIQSLAKFEIQYVAMK